MHKLVASLLLALSAAALLSQETVRANPSRNAEPVRLSAQATLGGHAWHREDRAAPGAYFDLALSDGVRVTYRLAALDHATARIDAVVVRDGLTLLEPDLVVKRGRPASIQLQSPPLQVEFRVDAATAGE